MRSDFSSSRLVRLLGGWAPVETPASGMDFAERLGLWLSAFDAIKLQAAHQSLRALAADAPPTGPRTASKQVSALQEQMQRVRAALAHAVGQDPVALAGADPLDPGFSPFQRRHGELQRHMEQMIVPLREQARLLLSQAGAAQRQLALLDATLQDMLATREQQLLAGVSGMLARRFEQLRRAHRVADALTASTSDDTPALDLPAPEHDWLQAFTHDWRQALLAELDLRLEPVMGLVEALNNEISSS